ncbi:uncharacterized protein LOC142547609 [Primulina tabacum]|uniref:uncharacterized protein LOC142547609 n=1 Tax=Primulina tabacum TaxID=48773 RepID=UPI003F5A1315
MDSGATSKSFVGKAKKADQTRRSWSEREEEFLIQAPKEASIEGWKSGNGFRPGYLAFLENRMKVAFPDTNLRGNPHINSKVHVWKKLYGSLVTLLNKSGVGWNDTEKTIETSNDIWDALIKADNNARTMRHKMWTYYHDWCEIFGNDRATGDKAEHFTAAVQEVLIMTPEVPNNTCMSLDELFSIDEGADESMSISVIPSSRPTSSVNSKGKKWKHVDDADDAIVEAINNIATITKDTMKDLIKQLATQKEAAYEKMRNAQDNVLKVMETIPELTEDEKVIVIEELVDNYAELSLFLRLGHAGRLILARRLLRGG